MHKFSVGDTFELYDVPPHVTCENKRVWSVYRDVETIPIKIISIHKIKPEYQNEYGIYAYKCKVIHDDPTVYDDILLTEQQIFKYSI